MEINEIMMKMIANANGNLHDNAHFLKVWGYARTIGMAEKLSDEEQYILEASAIVHDISCPIIRKEFGNTDHKKQEEYSDGLIRAFFKDTDMPEEKIDRISWIVSHHHTVNPILCIEHQILLEADYLVNADEHPYPIENIHSFYNTVVKTDAGKKIMEDMYFQNETN